MSQCQMCDAAVEQGDTYCSDCGKIVDLEETVNKELAKSAQKQTSDSFRLHSLEIENVMRLASFRIDPNGRHVVISGPNKSGKTSFVRTLAVMLGFKPPKEMHEWVHDGAEHGHSKANFGEYIVECYFTPAGGTRLVVTSKDGKNVKGVEDFLESFAGPKIANPVSFLDLPAKKQVLEVMQLYGIKPPVDQVREIVDESDYELVQPIADETADEYLERLCGDNRGEFYIRRREANKALTQKQKAIKEQRETLDAMGGDPPPPADSMSELLGQMNVLRQQANDRQELVSEIHLAERDHERAVAALAAAERMLTTEEREIAATRKKIKELEQALEGQLRSRDHCVEQVHEKQLMVHDAKELAVKAVGRIDDIPDPGPEIAAVQARLTEAERQIAKVNKQKVLYDQWLRMHAEAKVIQEEKDKSEGVLKAVRYIREHMLDGFDVGITGLEIGYAELRLNGFSFCQASSAEQLQVACAICMKRKPGLHLIIIDNGERLDKDSRKMLFDLADKYDWQVAMTAVSDKKKLRVEFVDKEFVDGEAGEK